MDQVTATWSWKDVAEHNSAKNCWLSIRGKVYDVTSWVDRHPGGTDILALNAGRDATQLFECYHPMGPAVKMLDQYCIGVLRDSEHPVYPPVSRFYMAVKERVYAHMASRGLRPKHAPGLLLFICGLLLAALMLYCLILWLLPRYFGLALVATVVISWFAALFLMFATHDASHAAVTSSPWVWRLLGSMSDTAVGISFYMWYHQHFLGHHIYTNLAEYDPDVETHDPDIRRIKHTQAHRPYFRLQALYVPLLYCLLGTKFRINDILMVSGLLPSNGKIRINPLSTWHLAIFWLGKILFVVFRFVIPFALLGWNMWARIFVVIVLSDAIGSFYLAICFQLNHVVGQTLWPQVSADPSCPGRMLVDTDWATSQVLCSMDYAHDSRLVTFLTGGLNYQVVHHLLPEISQVYYPEIAPIVRDTCAEFGIPYTILPTFFDALKAHISYLNMMGMSKLD